jgi:hypothetical protein
MALIQQIPVLTLIKKKLILYIMLNCLGFRTGFGGRRGEGAGNEGNEWRKMEGDPGI